jgi:hypothetical protein
MRRLAATALILAGLAGTALTGTALAGPPADDPVGAAMDRFLEAARQSREIIRSHPFYADPQNRAAGMAYLSSMMIRTLEEDVVQDPDFPFFRVLDPRIREGGDNSDQRYLVTPIRGGERYRVWGTLGKQRRLDFQIYQGDPWIKGGGRVVSALTFDQIKFDKDGRFEVILSASREPGNWLQNAPDATKLFVRQIFSDWKNETPGEVHIDRVGHAGDLKPRLGPDEMVARLDRAAVSLKEKIVPVWPNFVLNNYVTKMPANTLTPPHAVAAMGGLNGRWMSEGHFDLADDEALVVTTWKMNGDYQGFQLTDLWWSSLEYGNRQSSLTADQAWRSPDGAYRFVIAARDPGVQNWLDTTGLRQGTMLLRFDGVTGDFPKSQYPQTVKVKLADLKSVLPADTPAYGPTQRAAEIAVRRRHVQERFHD